MKEEEVAGTLLLSKALYAKTLIENLNMTREDVDATLIKILWNRFPNSFTQKKLNSLYGWRRNCS